jgi:hypothetical protein
MDIFELFEVVVEELDLVAFVEEDLFLFWVFLGETYVGGDVVPETDILVLDMLLG